MEKWCERMTTGEKIKYLRTNIGITSEELANITGINHSLIKKYETNRVVPKQNQIEKLAKALNVSRVVLIMSEIEVDTLWCDCYNKLERLLLSNYKITEIDEKQVDADTVFIGITLNNILEKE